MLLEAGGQMRPRVAAAGVGACLEIKSSTATSPKEVFKAFKCFSSSAQRLSAHGKNSSLARSFYQMSYRTKKHKIFMSITWTPTLHAEALRGTMPCLGP